MKVGIRLQFFQVVLPPRRPLSLPPPTEKRAEEVCHPLSQASNAFFEQTLYSHTKKLQVTVTQKISHDCKLNKEDKCTPWWYGMCVLGQDMEH